MLEHCKSMISSNRNLFLLTLLCVSVVVQAEDDCEIWIQRWGINDAYDIDFDPETGHLLANYRGSAVLWDVRNGLALRHYRPVHDHDWKISVVKLCGQDRVFVASDDRVDLLNRENGELIRSFELVEDGVRTLEVSSDGTLLAVGGGNGSVRIWNINTGNLLYCWTLEILARAGLAPDRELALHRRTSRTMLCCHQGQALDLSIRISDLAPQDVPALVRSSTDLKAGTLMELAAEIGAIGAVGAPAAHAEQGFAASPSRKAQSAVGALALRFRSASSAEANAICAPVSSAVTAPVLSISSTAAA